MPEHTRGDGTPRTPRARDATDAVGAWQRAQSFDFTHRGDEREVARGPDVGATKRHQQIDVGGPWTDPSELDERGSGLVVVECGERVGIKGAFDDRPRDVSDVGAFLPSESGATQVGLTQGRDSLGRHGAGKPLQPSVGGAARRQRYLLLENDLNQGLEAWRPVPQRWRPVAGDDCREMWIPPREFGHGLREALRCELKRHVHLTREATSM